MVQNAGLFFYLTAFEVLFLGSGFAVQAFFPRLPPYVLTDLSEGSVLAITVVVLVRRNWFREAGFNSRRDWRDLRVLWLPALVAAFLLLSLVGLAANVPGQLLVALGLSSVLIGFSEESSFRGVVLRMLVPSSGPRRAVLLSAFLFALLHFNNAVQAGVRGNLPSVGLAVVFAFLTGIGLGAFRVRTNTIWPLIAFHAASDLPGLVIINTSGYSNNVNLPTAALEIGLGVMLASYGLFLIRRTRTPA